MRSRSAGLLVGREVGCAPGLSDQVRAVYEQSFPPSQRCDFSRLLAAVCDGARWLFMAKAGDRVLGFAVTLPLPEANAHMLEYMAVAKSYRGQGIGAKLFSAVRDAVRSTGGAAGVILEVEPDDQGTKAQKEARRRRIRFYCRNGAHIVECAPRYRAPDMSRRRALRMKLMWLPLQGSGATLSGGPLRDCVRAIYVRSYERAGNDPLLTAVLSDLVC